MRKFAGFFRRQRGMTLIELLIAVAIFSTAAIPVMSLIYSTVNNNRNSRIALMASSMSASAMEELKSVSSGYYADNTAGIFYENSNFKIEYLIEPMSGYILPQGNIDNPPPPVLGFEISNTSFSISDTGGNTGLFDIANSYLLEIKGAPGICSYLYQISGWDETGAPLNSGLFLVSGTAVCVNGTISIHISTETGRMPESMPLTLHVRIGEDLTAGVNVNFYIYNDPSCINLYNDGNIIFNQYYNMDSRSGIFTAGVYRITVTARKKDPEQSSLGSIVSYGWWRTDE